MIIVRDRRSVLDNYSSKQSAVSISKMNALNMCETNYIKTNTINHACRLIEIKQRGKTQAVTCVKKYDAIIQIIVTEQGFKLQSLNVYLVL